jgi:outer membrane cobalamin receptor
MCAALACARGWAQDVPTLEEVVVTANRVDTSILDSPSAVSIISAQQIADSGATDVSQVINGQPGVVVNDYGPQGATKSVGIRGSTSSQVLVLLDGIRLNSSRDGGVDLSSIPMEIIDHIEIVRGGESSLYGSSAIGGVINIITRKAEKPSISLRITNGSYIPHAGTSVDEDFQPFPPAYPRTPVASNSMDLLDSQNVDLSVLGKLGRVGLSAGGSFVRAANGYTWFDATDLGDWRRRDGADTLSGSAFAGVDAPLLGGQLAVKGIFGMSDTGSPGSLTLISLGARQTDTSASGSFGWKTDHFLIDPLTLDLKGFFRYDQLGYTDPDPVYPVDSLHQTGTARLDLTQKLTISDQVAAIYGWSASYDSVNSTNYAALQSRSNFALFLSVPLSFFDVLTITPSGRVDYFSDFASSSSYSLSAVLALSEESSLHASFASAYRVPDLNDMYWYDASGFTGANPELRPERSYEADAGWVFLKNGVSLEASVFARQVFDNIIWLYDPLVGLFGTYLPENLTRTFFPGAELRGKVAITDRISVEASYTFLDSFLLNDGGTELGFADNRRVPYAPMHSVSAQARYTGKVLALGVELRYLAEQFTDTDNTVSAELPGYFLANADLGFTASNNVAFTMALKNIFNALYFTQLGYPMPPFALVTGVNVKL